MWVLTCDRRWACRGRSGGGSSTGGLPAGPAGRADPDARHLRRGSSNHLLGLTVAFRDAAAKLDGPTTNTPPAKVTEPLPDAWRDLLDKRLAELAAAWASADAWSGMTKAGGVDLPGEIWRARRPRRSVAARLGPGPRHRPDFNDVSDAEADAVLPIVTPEQSDPDGRGRGDLFGPVVAVPVDAPPFDRVLGLAGRAPAWSPAD